MTPGADSLRLGGRGPWTLGTPLNCLMGNRVQAWRRRRPSYSGLPWIIVFYAVQVFPRPNISHGAWMLDGLLFTSAGIPLRTFLSFVPLSMKIGIIFLRVRVGVTCNHMAGPRHPPSAREPKHTPSSPHSNHIKDIDELSRGTPHLSVASNRSVGDGGLHYYCWRCQEDA